MKRISIQVVLARNAYTGRLSPHGHLRVDLDNASYDGGYYEHWIGKRKVSWGSFATLLGGLFQAKIKVGDV